MRRTRSVILVTGFGPFPGAPRNASSLLAEALAAAARSRLPGYAVHAETLPTEWVAGPARLAALLDALEPAVAVHFGVSHRARGFVLETRAQNHRRSIVDACGAGPDVACVAAGAPDALAATLPTRLIVERLRRKGLPVQLSRDAGGYLCNAVLYHSLDAARQRAGCGFTRRGFVHIPDRLSGASRGAGTRFSLPSLLDWPGAVEGGLEILAACAGGGPSFR